ncbi:hypothetical protein HZB00_01435 [Candidatus Woesearchaeota archaeon]|nr:hypothetical protein [Candidatus Woesearchaeota archaeon]
MQILIGAKRFTVKDCGTIHSQARGLLFTSPKTIHGALFSLKKPKRIALHSLFLFHSLTLVYLDDKQKVLGTGKLPPFTFFYLTPKVSSFVELFGNHSFQTGDVLTVKEE